MQQILVYFALGIALAYLYNKFFGKKNSTKSKQDGTKTKKNCGGDDTNCGCN